MRQILLLMFMAASLTANCQKFKGIIGGLNLAGLVNIENVGLGNGFVIGGFVGANRYEPRSGILELTVRTNGYSVEDGDLRLFYANAAALKAFRLFGYEKARIILGLQPTLFLGKTEPEIENVTPTSTPTTPVYCNEENCFHSPRPLNVSAIGGFEYWGKVRLSFRLGLDLISKNRFQTVFAEFAVGI